SLAAAGIEAIESCVDHLADLAERVLGDALSFGREGEPDAARILRVETAFDQAVFDELVEVAGDDAVGKSYGFGDGAGMHRATLDVLQNEVEAEIDAVALEGRLQLAEDAGIQPVHRAQERVGL